MTRRLDLDIETAAFRLGVSPRVIDEARRQLGRVPDCLIAARLGVATSTVKAYRRRRGIASAGLPRPRNKRARARALRLGFTRAERRARVRAAPLGLFPDAVIARDLGVSPDVVGWHRRAAGIPACRPEGEARIEVGGALVADVEEMLGDNPASPLSPREIAAALVPAASIRSVHRALAVLVLEDSAERVRRGTTREWGYVKRSAAAGREEGDDE